jgi:hypothetical protein
MKLHRTFACVLVFGIAASGATAQKRTSGDALNAIREADIKSDIFTLAGDAMRGREAGTLDELRASVWVGGGSEQEFTNVDLKGKIAAARPRLEPGFKL